MHRSGSNQETKPGDGVANGKGSPAFLKKSSSGLLPSLPRTDGAASTTWQAVGVFVTLLVLLQAMSYSYRVWQGHSLPQHRRRSWHDMQFHSYYQEGSGGGSRERLSGAFHAEPPGIAEIIHEEVDELSATLEELMHDPALQMELEPGQGDLDLDVGMDPRQMPPVMHEGEGGGWGRGEGEGEGGGASEPWADLGLSGAHSEADPMDAGAQGAASLAQDPLGREEEGLGGAGGGGGAAVGADGAEEEEEERQEESVRGAEEEAVAEAKDERVAAPEEKKAEKKGKEAVVPARVVTKQQQPSKPQQQPQAKAAKPPPKQEEPKEKPVIKPSRPRPGGHAARIAKIVEKLYRDKKVYDTFTGHVAMSRATLPPVGKDIRTPWKMIPKGNWRTLGKVTQSLLQVLPATDVVGSKHYKTCAVVGSAGILLTQDYGHEIDKHDCVIRFNIAPTKGFEAGVGAKTTLRFVNRLHFGFRETPNEAILQHVTMPDMMAKYINMMKKNPKMPTYPFDMSFYEQMIDWHRVQQPTNGYFGMKLALHLCDRIDVYGFVRNWRGNFKYHYFNAEEPNAQQFARDKQGELPLIQELMEKHKQRMFFMHPCILDSKCEGCPSAAKCVADVPYAVPKPGYCRSKGSNCWLKCDSCPGGKKNVICPADVSGSCVQ